MKANIQFNAEQNKIIRSLIKSALGESVEDLQALPELKGPYIQAAKEQGFTHAQSLVIANQVFDEFKKRAEEDRQYKENYKEYVIHVGSAGVRSMTESQIRADLKKRRLNTSKAEVNRAFLDILMSQIKYATYSMYNCQSVDVTVDATAAHARRLPDAHIEMNDELYWHKRYLRSFRTAQIKVSADYHKRVTENGIATVEGCLVLDAKELNSGISETRLFRAVWLKQGRGYALLKQLGYIAKCGDFAQFGETADAALGRMYRAVKAA